MVEYQLPAGQNMLVDAHDFNPNDLIGGHISLDFINTVTARDTDPRDWLQDFSTLLAWATFTARFHPADLQALGRSAARTPAKAEAALARCKELRETLHRVFTAMLDQRSPSRNDLDTLNEMRRDACARTSLSVVGGGIAAVPVVDGSGLDLISDRILFDALDFLRDPPMDRLRACDGTHCGWLFHDTSKGGRRRWCDMRVCGLAEKMRRHRGGAVSGLLLVAAMAGLAPAADASATNITRWTPANIASNQYESSPSFTPDGGEMYFMRANRAFTEYSIMLSRCSATGWTRPEPAPFAKSLPVSDADPFVTRDGKRLYFVSSRQAPGKSGDDLDIWYVERTAGGAWGEPVRLPAPVNSPHSEILPRLTGDGRIFFGSNRPGGLGGNDVYVATPSRDGRWAVSNLGPDVNNASNDFEADVTADGKWLVLVSDRDERSHLYRYERVSDRWRARGRVPAKPDVFQVGPLLSPRGDRLLFAQADGPRSGELFLADMVPNPDRSWPTTGRCAR